MDSDWGILFQFGQNSESRTPPKTRERECHCRSDISHCRFYISQEALSAFSSAGSNSGAVMLSIMTAPVSGHSPATMSSS